MLLFSVTPQPCREAQRVIFDVDDERSKHNRPPPPLCLLCESCGYGERCAVCLTLSANVIDAMCSVARTLARPGIYEPDPCLNQPWYGDTG
jgi:hypothetical protein